LSEYWSYPNENYPAQTHKDVKPCFKLLDYIKKHIARHLGKKAELMILFIYFFDK